LIDFHSHILPGIDDGARSMEDSLGLIKQSVNSGVTKIIATPHINLGTFDNDLCSIQNAFHGLIHAVKKANLKVELAYAAEVRICPEIMPLTQSSQLPFLGKFNDNNVLLLEFPHSHILPGSDKLVNWLINNKITPMIPHPERNRELWKHPYLINDFINKGCLLQITAASLIGDFGRRSKSLAWQLLESEHVYAIASDMHNLKRRPNLMSEAYQLVASQYGRERAELLCVDNPDVIFSSNSSVISCG